MKNLLPELHEEYLRISDLVKNEKDYTGENLISLSEVLKAHYLLIDHFAKKGEKIGLRGPRGTDLLLSALSRQTVEFNNAGKWKDDYQVISTLFYGLIQNHPFHDCNKRTALLILLHHLLKCKKIPTLGKTGLEDLTISIASNDYSLYPKYDKFNKLYSKSDACVYFIADYLRLNTRPAQETYHPITYSELRDRLLKFEFSLELLPLSDGKKAGIFKIEKKKSFFGQVKIIAKKLIGQITFKGWEHEVSFAMIKRTRNITGLTSELGYDSQSFFENDEIFYQFIITYEGPLKRLADK
jgi:death-on-curing protein